MRIWKFGLDVADVQQVMMPEGAQILSVQTQMETPQLWALVDPSRGVEARTIALYGTGHPMPTDPGRFLGTFQLSDGALVFHAFEPAQRKG